MTQIFDRIALCLVIHQRAVEIRVDQQIAHVVVSHELRILVPAKRLDLPCRRTVISLHRCHALQGESLAHQVRAHVFLAHPPGKAAGCIQPACHAHGLDGFDRVHPALGLDILADQFIGSLRRGKHAAAKNGKQQDQKLTHSA